MQSQHFCKGSYPFRIVIADNYQLYPRGLHFLYPPGNTLRRRRIVVGSEGIVHVKYKSLYATLFQSGRSDIRYFFQSVGGSEYRHKKFLSVKP